MKFLIDNAKIKETEKTKEENINFLTGFGI